MIIKNCLTIRISTGTNWSFFMPPFACIYNKLMSYRSFTSTGRCKRSPLISHFCIYTCISWTTFFNLIMKVSCKQNFTKKGWFERPKYNLYYVATFQQRLVMVFWKTQFTFDMKNIKVTSNEQRPRTGLNWLQANCSNCM